MYDCRTTVDDESETLASLERQNQTMKWLDLCKNFYYTRLFTRTDKL